MKVLIVVGDDLLAFSELFDIIYGQVSHVGLLIVVRHDKVIVGSKGVCVGEEKYFVSGKSVVILILQASIPSIPSLLNV
jgi:hypothetical protein